MIRSFDLLDLPTLHRYRHQGLCMDTALALTWGVTLVPAGALLSTLAPATGIFTTLSSRDDDSKGPVLGQAIHHAGANYARLTFLAPESALDSTALHSLIEHLATQVGERGAHNLLAEVDESSEIYEALRKAGFAIYARQRVWKVAGKSDGQGDGMRWRSAISTDEIAIRFLYNALVPALVQQVEPPPWERLRGLTCRKEGALLAYVDLNYGPRGIMATPYIHPDVEPVALSLGDLIEDLPNRLARPVYIGVRSYQSWLESALEVFGAQPGPRQAVMVKRLAVHLQEPTQSPLPAIQGTRANPTVPFTRSITPRARGQKARPPAPSPTAPGALTTEKSF